MTVFKTFFLNVNGNSKKKTPENFKFFVLNIFLGMFELISSLS